MLLSRKIGAMCTDYQTAHQKRKIWQRVVTVLACFVVFCTTYALILPAITMETTADPNAIYCGAEGHTHGEDCYDANLSLVCSVSEHTHSLACYSNPKADLENKAHWQKIASGLNLAKVWDRDLLNVALSQRDYAESDRNYLVLEDGTRHGYTRYGAWNEDAYGDWNAAFVGWCLEYAGISRQYIPYNANPAKWVSLLQQQKMLQPHTHKPQKGDLVFLDTDKNGVADRVGILSDYSFSYTGQGVMVTNLTVLEGDSHNAVAETAYTTAEVVVSGYLPLAPIYEKFLEDNGLSGAQTYAVPIFTDPYYTTQADDDAVISIEGVLPLDAKPRAYPVKASVDGKDVICSYDISIFLSDGSVYEPSQYVTVSIKQPNIPASSAVYYLPAKGEPEKMTSRPSVDGVSFDTGHFSVYAVVGTTPEEVTDLNEKPVSGADTGWIRNFVTDITEIRGKYASDPITANIEAGFTGVLEDDGKLMTDKSVLYNKNDYYTFNNYGTDEFSVTLSALSQQYAQSYEIKDKAPVDVVMILDISGSMEAEGTNNEKRIDVATESINYFINNLMLLHPENRVGIVVFANNSEVFLPLGRYYVGSGTPSYSDTGTVPSYIVCDSGGCTYSNNTYSGIATNDSLKTVTTNGQGGYVSSAAVAKKAFCDYGGTFTQSGIARAAEMFLDQTDLTYTATTGDVLKRMPVTLLLSDGEPTFCTEDYDDVLNGNLHGSGVGSSADNPKGVQGYYTILSGNYYKQQIANHYQYQNKAGKVASFFYSVGMGINETGVDAAGDSTASGDHYKRAVLNPHPEEVALLTDTSAENYTTNALQLYQLLNNTYSDSSVSVGNSTYNSGTASGYRVIGTSGTSTASVPVAKNPYTDYAYADDGFFSSEYSKVELAEVMDTILVNMINNETYIKSFPDSVSNVHFYDAIGEGMEITSDLILRYNGLDYAMSLVSNQNGIKKYQYMGTEQVRAYVGSPTAYALSEIWAEITTDATGHQTLHWFIPATLVPELAYYQGMTSTDYYQMYPVRLIYKVGLTDASKNAIGDLKEGDAPLVFYTNGWQNDTTTVRFQANENNPYYQNRISVSLEKQSNLTQTRSTYFESQGTTDITDLLGNNGKLVFQYEVLEPDEAGEKTNVKVEKQWSDGDDTHASDSVTMTLLADGAAYDTVTLNATNNWVYIWQDIPKYFTNGQAIDWSVQESKTLGYQSIVGQPADGAFVVRGQWNDISAFTAGETVRIVYNNQALSNSADETLAMADLDSDDLSQQWLLDASGSYFTLQNKATGRYLNATSTTAVSTSTSAHNWTLRSSNGNLLLRSATRSRNLRITNTGISMNSSGTAISPQAYEAETLPGRAIIVTNHKQEAGTTTALTIEKQWLNADGSPDTTDAHQEVTVTLYADGEAYTTVTLNAANDWKATLPKLPITWSVTPEQPIQWTYQESKVNGYVAVFGQLEKTSATGIVFQTKEALADNETFWIADANENALTASGTSLTTAATDPNNANQQWIAESNGNAFYLKKAGTNSYLVVNRSGSWGNYSYSLALSSSTKQNWTYNNGELQNGTYTSYSITLDAAGADATTNGTEITLGRYEEEAIHTWRLPLINRAGFELPATGGYALFVYLTSALIALGGILYWLYACKKPLGRRFRR